MWPAEDCRISAFWAGVPPQAYGCPLLSKAETDRKKGNGERNSVRRKSVTKKSDFRNSPDFRFWVDEILTLVLNCAESAGPTRLAVQGVK